MMRACTRAHQVLPFDAPTKLVTHNFLPERIDECMDLCLESWLAWSSHPKFIAANLSRIGQQCPDSNMKSADQLKAQVKALLDARKKAQRTAWGACTLLR